MDLDVLEIIEGDKTMKLNNKYYILRHGEARSNIEQIVSCWPEKFENALTKKGRGQIESAAKKLKDKKIDLIFNSPLLRTKESAAIVGKALKIKPRADKRLRELGFGIFNGKHEDGFMKYFNSKKERLKKRTPRGENYEDVLKRIWDFFSEINKKYKQKNILIVSHQAPLLLLLGKIIGEPVLKGMDGIINVEGEKRITRGELIEIN